MNKQKAEVLEAALKHIRDLGIPMDPYHVRLVAKQALQEARGGDLIGSLTETGQLWVERQGGAIYAVYPNWREDPRTVLGVIRRRIQELRRDEEHLEKLCQGNDKESDPDR